MHAKLLIGILDEPAGEFGVIVGRSVASRTAIVSGVGVGGKEVVGGSAGAAVGVRLLAGAAVDVGLLAGTISADTITISPSWALAGIGTPRGAPRCA